MKNSGVIQGFWSINPEPLEKNGDKIKATEENGYFKFDSVTELKEMLDNWLSGKLNFFSSMKSKKELGRIIEMANRKKAYEEKAEEFIRLLKE